jgi:hypothetical protein
LWNLLLSTDPIPPAFRMHIIEARGIFSVLHSVLAYPVLFLFSDSTIFQRSGYGCTPICSLFTGSTHAYNGGVCQCMLSPVDTEWYMLLHLHATVYTWMYCATGHVHGYVLSIHSLPGTQY